MYSDEDSDLVYASLTSSGSNFEGAATNYKTGLRGLLDGEADTLAVRELRYLQSRSKHLTRNNGHARIALKSWVTNVGNIKTVWKTKNGKVHKVMQGYWEEFIKNPSFDGFGDMDTFQGVSNSSIFSTGTSYIRKLIIRDGKSTVPLKLQLIPSVLHDVAFNQGFIDTSDKVIRYGMTFVDSVPTEYHFRKSVLDRPLYGVNPRVTVPADEIIHTFIRDEPGQWLGIPLLSSVILSLYELDDLLTATVSKQKAAQSLAILIEQTANTIAQLPVGGHKEILTPDGKKKVIFQSDAAEAQVLYLNKGESAKMFQGTDIGANFGVLADLELRKIATVADLAYHQLTGDVSGLNYSSLIGIAIQSRNRLEYLHNTLFIPLREAPIADAFKELAVLYNPKVASAVPYFQLPRWRGIDDLKDAQSDLLELQNGLGTYTDKLAERGLSVEDILADRESMKELEAFGVTFTSADANTSMAQANNTQANSNTTST